MTQNEALEILKTGANVFLTGEPGSGKTHTINTYVEYLRSNGISPAITASTGIAATHLNGTTIHSWSGIGINRNLSDEDLDNLSSRKRLISRINKTHVLIIDEISMLDAQILDMIESTCRTIKQKDLPWGGIQVIFVGDFFQLPPVRKYGEPPIKFSFESLAWQSADPIVCYIEEQFRQDDHNFINLLKSIRDNNFENETHEILESRKVRIDSLENDYTRLYSHNIDVDRINNQKLEELPGLEERFYMESRGPKNIIEQMKRGCLSPEILRLKIGAKVMFTKNNFEEGYVNGTLGHVEEFSEDGFPSIRTLKGDLIEVEPAQWEVLEGSKTLAQISQIPLRLAWAITVHKSQGMTLDSAIIDLSSAFEYGQGYVALSRIRTLDGLFLCGYNQMSLQVHPEILKIDSQFRQKSEEAKNELAEIPKEDIVKKQKDFIVVCGGKEGGITKKETKTKKSKKLSPPKNRENTYEKTLILWQEGKSVDEIAEIRELTRSTVISHLEELYIKGKIGLDEIEQLASPEILDNLSEIKSAFEEVGGVKLFPVFEKFAGKFTYEDLRIARIIIEARSE